MKTVLFVFFEFLYSSIALFGIVAPHLWIVSMVMHDYPAVQSSIIIFFTGRCKEYTRHWRSCVATVNKRFEQRYRAGIVSAGQFQFAISSPPIVWERRAWSLRVSCRQCTSYRVSPPQHYLAVFITRFNGVVQSFQPKPSLPPSSSIDHVTTYGLHFWYTWCPKSLRTSLWFLCWLM